MRTRCSIEKIFGGFSRSTQLEQQAIYLSKMAPTRTVKSSTKFGKDPKNVAKSRTTKAKVSKKAKVPPPKQQKTKSATRPVKKKRVYTEKELGIPKLNMITPVGVELPKGKKKGKVFVDDQVDWPFVCED